MEPETSEFAGEQTEQKRRLEWQENHAILLDAINALRPQLKRFPKLAELKAHTGLSIATIERHIKSLKNQPGRFESFRMMTENVLWAMHDGAVIDRDARCGKLWFQVAEDWVEAKKVTQVNQNPYAGLSEEDIKKKAQARRDSVNARKKALDAAKEIES